MGLYKSVEVKESFCIFIDALGFKNDITANSKKGNENNHLRKFHSALTEALEWLNDITSKKWEIKVFTDNIVLGAPLDCSGLMEDEGVFGIILNNLLWFQWTMINHDFFFRGGWSMGSLFMDESIVYGRALIEAHNEESCMAKYPRVTLSLEMKNLVEKHMEYYFDESCCPQLNCILQDENGTYFLNYLFAILTASDERSSIKMMLKSHKLKVERNIKNNENNVKEREKYEWVAFYHNYFCENYIIRCPKGLYVEGRSNSSWEIKRLPWDAKVEQ